MKEDWSITALLVLERPLIADEKPADLAGTLSAALAG